MLEVRHLKKEYKTKGGSITKALDDVSIVFPEKGLIFLLGKSGSGKSTLLNVIGGLDRADSGEIIIKGKNSKEFSASDFDSYRNTFIGFVFQEYNILNEFNIEQNISLALQLQGKKNDREAVNEILKQVDLEKFGKRKPNTLSGGQKQRVAIARALIKSPEIIMADEPTGALDSKTGQQIFDTLKELSKEKLIIVVSHDRDFAELYADRIIELADGKIISDTTKEYIKTKELGNIHIVNDHTLAIKDVSKITKKDVEVLLENLKDKKGEILLTSGDKDLHAVRQAIHLSDDNSSEVFKDTKDVETKEYDPKQTKFIRSHLPFGRAFKMGSSYLKLKPVRLVFTSLLTVISLTLFGAASTLMLFKDSFAYANALKDTLYKSEVVAKKYDVKRKEHHVKNGNDEVTYENDETEFGAFSKEEINNLNSNSLGLNFAPVLTFNLPSRYSGGNNAITISSPFDANAKAYYNYAQKPSGIIPTSKEYIDANNDLSLQVGTYPKDDTEVAISSYTAEYLKAVLGYAADTADTKLINQSITVSINGNRGQVSKKLKVSGIIETPTIDAQFAELKNESTTKSAREIEELQSNFEDYMKNDFASFLYTSANFGESFIDQIFSPDGYSYIRSKNIAGLFFAQREQEVKDMDVTPDSFYNSVFTSSIVENNKGSFSFYDATGKAMEYKAPAEKEVYLPYAYLNDFIRQNYWELINRVNELLARYTEEEYKRYSPLIRDLTSEEVEAYQEVLSLVQDMFNKGSGFDPESIDSDPDFITIKGLYNTLYKEYRNNRYTMDSLMSYFNLYNRFKDSGSVTFPAEVTTMKARYEAIPSDLTTYDYSDINDFNEYLTDETEKLFVYNTIDRIFNNVTSDPSRYNVSDSDVAKMQGIGERYWDYGTPTYPTNEEITWMKEMVANLLAVEPGMYEFSEPSFVLPVTDFSPEIDPITEYWFKSYTGEHGKLKVLGYVKAGNESYIPLFADEFIEKYSVANKEDTDYYYTETVTEYVSPEKAYYSGAISMSKFTQKEVEFMQSEIGTGARLALTDSTSQHIESTLSLFAILKPVFLITGAVLGVFAALMLLNYVSASISSKTREIGILRAVGARGSDLFKIFFSESGLMTAICLVLSIVASAIVIWRLNVVFQTGLMKVALLDFGLLNVLLMIAGAVLITIVGTIIPVVLAARKQPVESIRSL